MDFTARTKPPQPTISDLTRALSLASSDLLYQMASDANSAMPIFLASILSSTTSLDSPIHTHLSPRARLLVSYLNDAIEAYTHWRKIHG